MEGIDWAGQTIRFIKETERLRLEEYDDVGTKAIGYGHNYLPGEDFSKGIDAAGADDLLLSDYVRKEGEASARIGGSEKFAALDGRRQAMLGISAWNPGWGPRRERFEKAVIANDLEGQRANYKLYSGEDELVTRNERFYEMFLRDPEEYGPPTKQQITIEKSGGVNPRMAPEVTPAPGAVELQGDPLKTYVESEEYQMLAKSERVGALAARDQMFAAMLAEDPEAAREFADDVAALGSGVDFHATFGSSISGGIERGVGMAVMPIAGAIRILEDRGLVETDLDDDILDYAHQRMIDGESRIGTDWEDQLAGMVGSFGAAIVPAAAATGVAATGLWAAGASGIPLAVMSQMIGLGSVDYLTGYAEDGVEGGVERGSIGLGLGAVGGFTNFMPRLWRAPIDLTAGLIAGKAQGLEFDQNMIQALTMATIGGVFPQARPSPKKLKGADMDADSFPGAAGVMAESRSQARERAHVRKIMEEKLDEPIVSKDGVEYHTVGDALRAQGDAIERTPAAHWAPQDRTPEQNAKWDNKQELSAQDSRPVKASSAGPTKDAPRAAEGPVYYRGTRKGGERSVSGNKFWDEEVLFAADTKGTASLYAGAEGSVEQITFKPGSRILKEGTKEFVSVAGKWREGENLLEFASRAAQAAKKAGYDAVHFKRQSDVGTAILNESAVVRSSPTPRAPVGSSVKAEQATGWNPGWRHKSMRAFGQPPERLAADAGTAVRTAMEIMTEFASAFGFSFAVGKTAVKGALGTHWAKAREMMVLRRQDLQTMAHEWGHDIVVTEPALRRYVHEDSPELKADLDLLRNWISTKEVSAGGRPLEPGDIPSATVFKYKDEIPDNLKYLEELMANSYDRADLHEGFSEFMRVYLTNNEKYGGQHKLGGMGGDSPKLAKIVEDWVDSLPKAKKKAFEKFATDATKFVGQDANSSYLAAMGKDGSPDMVLQTTLSKLRQEVVAVNEGVWNMVNRSIGAEDANLVVAYFESATAASRLTDLTARRAAPELVRNSEGLLVERAGTGKSIKDIIQMVGPGKEMMKAATIIFNAPRHNELYQQGWLNGDTFHVRPRVQQYLKDLAKKKDKTPEDLKLLRDENNPEVPSYAVEDRVLSRMGANRRETQVTREQIQAGIEMGNNPHYAHILAARDELKKISRSIEDYGVASGIYSRSQADGWKEFNNEYLYKFKRDMSDQEAFGADPSHGNVRGGTGVQQLTGKSGRALQEDDWLKSMLSYADDTYRRSAANIAKQVMVDTVLSKPEGAGLWFRGLSDAWKTSKEKDAPFHIRVGAIDKPKGHTGTGASVIEVMREGKPYYYDMSSPGALKSVDFINPESLGKFLEAWGKVKTFRQETVTMNPDFFLPALVRDLPSAFLFSKTEGSVFKKAAVGFRHAWLNTPEYQNYIAMSSRASLTDAPHATRRALLREARKADSRVSQILHTPGSILGQLRRMSNAIEASTRFGEFQAAQKMGIEGKRAAYLGSRVQPNFQSHGTNMYVRGAVKTIPFLGATMNAVDRLGHWALRDADSKKQMAIRMGTLALSSIAMEELSRRMIPEYDDLPRWLKMAYHIIPDPKWSWENGFEYDDDGKLQFELTLIPKNHESGLIANVVTRVADEFYSSSQTGVAETMVDATKILLAGVGVRSMGGASPIPLPVLFDEALQAGGNYDFFRESPIENVEMTGRDAYSRVDSKTPEIWNLWGQFTQNHRWLPDSLESPTKARWLVNSLFGQFAKQGEQLLEYALNPNGPEIHSDEMAILRRFHARADKYSDIGTDFWETANELQQTQNTMNHFKTTMDMKSIARMYQNPEEMAELFSIQGYADARRHVAKIENQIDMIKDAEGMDPLEKQKAIDRFRRMQRTIQDMTTRRFGGMLDGK